MAYSSIVKLLALHWSHNLAVLLVLLLLSVAAS
jgi:hypothetical protein